MRPLLSTFLTASILGGFLPGLAHGGDDAAKGPKKVFEAFTTALKKEDLNAAFSHLTADSQSGVAGMILLWAVLSREYSADDEKNGKERIASIELALKRHGFSPDKASWEKLDLFSNKVLRDVVPIGQTVKDKPALAGDFRKIFTRVTGAPVFNTIGEAIIEDIKIDGTTAKGMVKMSRALTIEGTNPVSIAELAWVMIVDRCEAFFFKMEEDVWKIDLQETSRNRPQYQPTQVTTPQIQPAGGHGSPPQGVVRRLFSRVLWR